MPPHGIVLVGRDNPYGSHPEWALYDEPSGCSGHRLRRFFGISSEDYRALIRVNLCAGPFNPAQARLSVAILRGRYPRSTFLLFGRDVQAAFGLGPARVPTFVPRDDPGDPTQRVLPLPHPSGLCREWTPAAVATFRAVMAQISPDLPVGTAADRAYPS